MTRSSSPRSSSVVRRMLVGLIGIAALVSVATVPSIQATEARFADVEQTSATFTASRLVTPVITACTVTSFLGSFTGVTISWTSPYLKDQERLSINTTVIPNTNVTQTGAGPYTYSATLSSGLLGTLLGSLLGSSNTVRVETVYPGTSWTSPAATRTLSVGGLLGLGGTNTCT